MLLVKRDNLHAQELRRLPRGSSRAFEGITRDLIDTRDGATCFTERVWGVSLRYDLGGDHSLVGRSGPDFELADGTRLGELLRKGTACCWTSTLLRPFRRS
jgi:hypothetical protein